MAGFLMTLKGLPSTYNKDMQEDKEPMFDAADTVAGSLQIAAGVLATLSINAEKMRASLSDDMLATDLAEYLVRKGVPFRETHHIAGAAVRMAEERKVPLAQLSPGQLRELHPSFADDVTAVWDFERSVEQRASVGGTSRGTVLDQCATL
ncbi:L-Aspartase-like protein, partial [Thamnocephalis sphaerospora]